MGAFKGFISLSSFCMNSSGQWLHYQVQIKVFDVMSQRVISTNGFVSMFRLVFL